VSNAFALYVQKNTGYDHVSTQKIKKIYKRCKSLNTNCSKAHPLAKKQNLWQVGVDGYGTPSGYLVINRD